MRFLKTILTLTIGVIRDPHVRRTCMFYCVLAALIMLFCGSTFLANPLRNHVWVFVGYWFVCAWMTMTALLLALYDMLVIRTKSRREQRKMEHEILLKKHGVKIEDEDSD